MYEYEVTLSLYDGKDEQNSRKLFYLFKEKEVSANNGYIEKIISEENEETISVVFKHSKDLGDRIEFYLYSIIRSCTYDSLKDL